VPILRVLLAAFAIVIGAPAVAADDAYPRDDSLRVNHVWSVGTHNSYHLRSPRYPNGPPPPYDYEQAPLDVQLDEQGVRKFELDVYWDPDEGIYRVQHVNVFDAASSCPTLVGCLGILRDWSLAHPGHVPIFVLVEPKGIYSTTTLSDEPLCDPPDHEVCHYEELDTEIRSVLAPATGPDLLVTPDEVRGARATLREAVLEDGWPTLRAARGRFVVALLDRGLDRDGYVAGAPSLEGRAMFVASEPGRDDAAVFLRDGPVGAVDEIQALVSLGYLVRTFADSLDDAQANDTTRRDAALASGAHFISTDYPVYEILGNGYFAAIPGGMPSGCNPVSTIGTECTPLDIENPAALVPEAEAPALALGALAWLGRRRRRA